MDEQGQLMPIGVVAAANIANALSLPAEHVPKIEQAIKDEINAMSSHFTLTFADIQTQYELEVKKLEDQYNAEVYKIKSTFSYLKANWGVALLLAGTVFSVGALVGHYV